LSGAVRSWYRFLTDLDDDEAVIARAREQDRSLALKMLAGLADGRLDGTGPY
jgi:hypothetical protein